MWEIQVQSFDVNRTEQGLELGSLMRASLALAICDAGLIFCSLSF